VRKAGSDAITEIGGPGNSNNVPPRPFASLRVKKGGPTKENPRPRKPKTHPHKPRVGHPVIVYFLTMGTEARVVSHSRLRVPPVADLLKEMVKFSTGEGSVETFMSMRARSLEGPG
jgi:hypothetical protein